MFFTILDLILLLIVFIFIAYGFMMGLIEAIGSLVGLVLGVWIGGIFYKDIGDWLSNFLVIKNLSYVVAFVVIYVLVSKLTGLAFYILNKVFKIFTFIPFLKTINRIAGAVLGLVEAVLVLGVVLLFLSQLPFSQWLNVQLAKSVLAPWLMAVAKILTPLLPKILVSINPLK